MKENKFLKTLLSSLMALSVISTSAAPVLAEDTEANPDETVVEAVESELAVASELSFEKTSEEGVTVSVAAPEGAFPAGTEMTIKKVTDEATYQVIADAVEGDVKVVAAYDITFTLDGEEIQPELPIQVTMTSEEIAAVENPVIVHVDEIEGEAVAEIVEQIAEETPAEEVTFDADKFSIYAVTDPGTGETDSGTHSIKYEFYTDNTFAEPYKFQNEEGVSTYVQYVSDGTGTDPKDKEDVLINPGAPRDAEHGVFFAGWYDENDNEVIPAEEETVKIESITENKTVKLYPKYETIYYIEYYDEHNIIYKTESTANGDFTVSGNTASLKNGKNWRVNYQPDSSTEAFQGWTLTSGSSAVVESVDFTGDDDRKIELYPYSAEVYWISFDKNDWVTAEDGTIKGTGAEYVAPLYILKTDANVGARYSTLPVTTRPGYTFAGWYENSDGTGEQLSTSTVITADTTYYAKWTPESTQYTIVYMRQYASDAVDAEEDEKHYYYDGSTTKYAPTESEVQLTASDYNSQIGDGFKFNQSKSDTGVKTVAADGSTVLTVYIDRRDYTLQFQKRSWGSWSTDDTLTIHELYGHKIADQWTGERWLDYNGVRYSRTKVLVMIDIMPNVNITFRYSDPESRPIKHMYYMVEALPNATNTQTYNGKTFVQYTLINARYYQVTEDEDFMDLNGFEKWTSNPTFSGGVALDDDREGTIHMYYTRNSYNLEFVDSFDNKEITKASVLYELPLTDYANYFTVSDDKETITAGGKSISHDGYTFTGWFSDPECKSPFDFNRTMPDAPIKVYAGWAIKRFRVWVQPNGGILSPTESTFFRANWGELIQEYKDVESNGRNYYAADGGEFSYIYIADTSSELENARVAYYKETSDLGTVTKHLSNNPDNASSTYNEADHTDGKTYKFLKDAYTFVGWYKVNKEISDSVAPTILENDDITPFNFNEPVKEATAIRAIWKRVGTFRVTYDANMYSSYTNEQGWLPENKTLDAAEGAVTPDDTLFTYGDLASAIAGAAPTKVPDGYIFVGWRLPTGDIVQHNDVFTIYSALSVYENPESSADPEYTYTLSAVYATIGTTNVTYNINTPAGATASSEKLTDLSGLSYETKDLGGSPKFTTDNNVSGLVKNSKLQLSNGEGFVVPGYGLKGWNDDQAAATAGTVKFDLGAEYAIGAPTILYAVWGAPTFYVYHSSRNNAADTENPIVETITTTPGQHFDIVAKVPQGAGVFYGGYFSDYGGKGNYAGDGKQPTDAKIYDGNTADCMSYWKESEAYQLYGRDFLPVDGTTYYLKEVPVDYLTPKTKFVYNTYRGNYVTKLFMLTAIDDANYQSIEAVDVDGKAVDVHVANKYTVKGQIEQDFTAKSLISKEGYVVVWNVKETDPTGVAFGETMSISALKAGQNVNQTLKVVTLDGVVVTRATRTVTVSGTDFATNKDLKSTTTNNNSIVYTQYGAD